MPNSEFIKGARYYLGQNIKCLRIARQLTQKELAHMTQISRPELSLIERGKISVKFSRLISIANSLEVGADALLDRSPNPETLIQKMNKSEDYYQRILSANLTKRRKTLRKTQTDVEIETGIPQAHYSRIENGKANIELDTLDMLAKVFETGASELLR